MAEPHMRKLTALALCVLLATNDPALLSRFNAIIIAIIDIMHDVEGPTGYDNFIALGGDPSLASTELVRQTQLLYQKDPVNVLNLRVFCLSKLEECAKLAGPQMFQQIMQSIEPSVLHQLQNPIQPPEPTLPKARFTSTVQQ